MPVSDRTDGLQGLTLALGDALTEAAVAQVVLQHAVPVLGAHSGSIARLSLGGSTLELIGWIGYPDEVELYRRFSIEQRLPHALAVKGAEPLFLEDRAAVVAAVGPLAESWTLPGTSAALAAIVALPLQAAGRTLGSLEVSFAEPRVFGETERSLALIVGRLCAQALQRAQAFEREQRARREAEAAQAQLELLANASHQLFGTLDPTRICQVLAQLSVDAGLAEFASVDLIDPRDGAPLRCAVSARDPLWLELEQLRRTFPPRLADKGDPVARAVATRAPQFATVGEGHDPAARRNGWKAFARRFHLRSRLVLPLLAGPAPLGALCLVTSARRSREISPRDLVLATELASRAAAALQNARLYSQAREAVGLRDDFLSIAGHELRTPLTALKLQLQSSLRLLLEAQTPTQIATVVERTEKATRQVDRLQALVDRLLDVSRVAAGRFALETELLSLDQIARDACTRYAEEAASAGCKLTLRLRDGEPELHGRWDRLRLEQLMANLLANAMKYGRGRPIEVEVRREGRFGAVAVRDQGVGIAPADHARVFERFERAAGTIRVGGLGLGLWISRQIAQAHGGNIQLKSQLGSGAEFVVTLPLLESHPGAGAS